MSRVRILVVEDNPVSQRLVHDILDYAGFEVVCAATVAEGEHWLAEPRTPALVVMDVEVPGGGGHALLARIRADARLRDVPVVAVTARAMSGDREALLADGFDHYLAKPIDTRTFAATIRGLIAARAGAV